ncbi:hypothetical protein CK510_01330 [Brunnivagina elsteri CCALA 953]|uniref:Uncharacterized protein n=2 Tax=Brunnivagina TaxID=3344733 RepID=A0A2A2TQ46_9CYAN|nr:hypothetical protein CK510_01330 [Calothrix elsteri CCALA 953]
MKNPNNAHVRQFLERFFGASNKFNLREIEGDEAKHAKILPWLELLTQVEPQSTVLPYWHGGIVDWYAIPTQDQNASSERQLCRLSEELMGFVGCTYSTFRGERAQLNLVDPVELAVYEFTEGATIKISGKATDIWEALEQMRRVGERRVKRIADIPQPTGRVLRDFYMALQASDRIAAESSLQYLVDQHRLDTLNLLFLRVQLLAELGQWNELLALKEFANLLQVRRPFAVTQALQLAVYRTQLQHFEDNNAPESAIAYFQEVVFPQYSNLFTARAGSTIPEVLKLFMLLAVAEEPTNPALRDELLTIPQIESSDRIYLEKLAAFLADMTPELGNVRELQQAELLCKSGDFDRGFLLLGNAPSSLEKVRLLLECAYELQILAAEKAALQAFDELTVEEQRVFLKVRWNQNFLTQLQGIQAFSIPVNWFEWLSELEKQPTWERAIQIARQGATEWDINSLLIQANARSITEFNDLLNKVASTSELILHESLPYLLQFFQKDEQFPRSEFFTLYYSLLELLVISTQGSDVDLVLFNDLAQALLTTDIDTATYTEILNHALELWSRFFSPKKVDWAIDLIDILVWYPSPIPEKRQQFLFAVAETMRRFQERIDEAQWELFRNLVKDLQLTASLPDLLGEKATLIESSIQVEANIFHKLKGKSILIYTLTETAAIRVKGILETACQEVTVHLSHDKGGNDRLRQWVRNSDIVVMVTASAKHAATGFIEAHRSSQLAPILLVNSKGSAGMLRVIREYLAG